MNLVLCSLGNNTYSCDYFQMSNMLVLATDKKMNAMVLHRVLQKISRITVVHQIAGLRLFFNAASLDK